ncbi:MAG: WD40 repeat domain-containing protein [Gemmataceae bacterium]
MSQAPPAAPKVDPTLTHQIAQWKHTAPLVGCRFDPTGKYVVAGAQDNSLVRWSVADGKATLLKGHRSWVRALAFSSQHGLMFSGDWAGQLLAWPVEGDAPVPRWNLAAHRGWVRALAVSPDGKLLASCGNDHLVKLWSLPDGKPVRTFAGHDCHVYQVLFTPDGRSLVSADLKGMVKVWDVQKGGPQREMEARILHKYDPTFMADIGGVRSMAFDAAGKYLACAGITNVSNAFAGIGNPLVVLFDFATGKQLLQLKPKVAFQGTAWGVAFHPSGIVLGVGGGNGGVLWAWKTDNAVPFHTLTLTGNARDLALHPDGVRLAVPYYDGFVRLYAMTGKKA